MGKVKHLTTEQKETHEKAVKLRKMTDAQLVAQVDAPHNTAAHFIEELKAACIPGSGKRVTYKQLRGIRK